MSNNYPRETIEFIPITITIDGAPVIDNVQVCVVVGGARPVTWTSPVTVGGQIGIMTTTQPVGTYTVWVKVTDMPEIPVINCGQYSVT